MMGDSPICPISYFNSEVASEPLDSPAIWTAPEQVTAKEVSKELHLLAMIDLF